MAPVYSRPWKSYPPLSLIYRVTNLFCFVGKLPFLLVAFGLFRSARPHPTWSVLTSVMVRALYALVDGDSRTEKGTLLSLEPGAEKERWKMCEPYPLSFYIGPLAAVPSCRPAKTGGTWFPSVQAAQATNAKVLYHIHGGAFVTGDGRTEQMGFATKTFLSNGLVDAIFSLQYRLSCRPGNHPFPAALQDVLTGYLYLTSTLNIPASQIVISGDSAGGNLAIAFLRYLSNHGQQLSLQPPRAALLFSPWISPIDNARDTAKGLSVTTNPNYTTDFLPPSFVTWGAQTYSQAVPATDPYITARGHPFRLPCPTWTTYGTVEILEIDGSKWVKEMKNAELPESGAGQTDYNSAMEIYYEQNAPHDTLLTGGILGLAESFHGVVLDAKKFLERNGL